MATKQDVRNELYMLAVSMGVNIAYQFGDGTGTEQAGDLELECWSPGDRDGTRYKVYQYRLWESGDGKTKRLVRWEPFGGYTCGASAMIDKLVFARQAVEAFKADMAFKAGVK
jgi:hypothetical protein